MEISCPKEMVPHVQQVLQGEYDAAYQGTPTILDVGANVGSFAVWASLRWPGSTIYCYEPSSSNFELLEKNIKQIVNGKVICNKVAVGDLALTKLYKGAHNCGENSLYDVGEQTTEFEEVKVVAPESLPAADILKLDTEGSEGYILEQLASKEQLQFVLVLLEYHGEDMRRKVDSILKEYTLVGGNITRPHRGVLKYQKTNTLP